MARYAEKTVVSSEKSRNEIEATLRRYGATAFAYAWSETDAQIAFQIGERRIIMRLPLPDRREQRFQRHGLGGPGGRWRPATKVETDAKWEQACRQSWRALGLIVKAKLEAVAAGISTIEREFLADIALPNGTTVGEWMAPQIALAYERNEMPALMPGSSS